MIRRTRWLPAVLAVAAAAATIGGCSVSGTPVADPAPPPTTAPIDTPSNEPWPTQTTPSSPTTDVPAPPDSQTIVCREYMRRDDATQEAIVKANGVTKNPILVASLVNVLCMAKLDETVASVINNLSDDITHK